MLANIGLVHYLCFSLFVFLLALWGCLVVRNLLRILILLEIMFCAVILNFISFANYYDQSLGGMVFGLFVMAVSAAQLALGRQLVVLYHKNLHFPASSFFPVFSSMSFPVANSSS